MKRLTSEEMKKVKGGISVWVGLGVAAVVVFLVGVIDGYVHPKACGGDQIASTN